MKKRMGEIDIEVKVCMKMWSELASMILFFIETQSTTKELQNKTNPRSIALLVWKWRSDEGDRVRENPSKPSKFYFFTVLNHSAISSLETWNDAESFFLSTEMPPIFPQNWTLICDFKVFIINKKSLFIISTWSTLISKAYSVFQGRKRHWNCPTSSPKNCVK